eukprot:CAMPEP_0175729536 /NCGR_PEP_ID=MMETSP0097-20121207/49852_1 /TAXON_ID=311494 /ORGANISM="Alexandrium monilatum, Strain CCMP3105" /LENGTH=212 /DNA_ID=CAMNT_0017037397 /DNA_START=21 /DNA_END=661 /DNA_ORIENTATION=-
MVDRLRGVTVLPMHCDLDKLCRRDLPQVERMYRLLAERNGVHVEWVPHKTARGSNSNFHSSINQVYHHPDPFFQRLSGLVRPSMQDAAAYLRQRLRELRPPAPPQPVAQSAGGDIQGAKFSFVEFDKAKERFTEVMRTSGSLLLPAASRRLGYPPSVCAKLLAKLDQLGVAEFGDVIAVLREYWATNDFDAKVCPHGWLQVVRAPYGLVQVV